MAEDYWKDLHADPFARERLKLSCELLNASNSDRILDVGCHKEEARKFLPIGAEYVGIDVLKGDDFDGEVKQLFQFSRILCLEVLEHLKYPRRTLASIVSLLKDDGILVLSLPNEASLFHRVRSLLGVVDQECFSENGKHLHLPSLKQAYSFVSEYLKIQRVEYYISDGQGTRQSYLRPFLQVFPKRILLLLSSLLPSLFSRGFIFVCVKKS